ncbi:DUF4265 domain-containing protein [Spirillospora sp. NPDC029432]|uniref:DUF4265 domain-containing protein n=1 Tax=Spirillospora sp. NPDC029432 TaxID=3154599 RepID=UPI00345594FC
MVDERDICVHRDPVGRDRADFIIMCDLTGSRMPGRWEQLWARTLDGGLYEICCVPFFAYGLSLGDEVSARSAPEFEWVVDSVVRPAPGTTLRAAFRDRDRETVRDGQREIVAAAERAGLPYEIHRFGYLAVHYPGPPATAELDEVLDPLAAEGILEKETSRPL